MKRNSQSGIALVITLVLLSVITFMAVTFLVVSRHEGAQVDIISQQSNAKNAADAAAQQAMAQAVAQMQANNNGLNLGLTVSRNFLSGTNFVSGDTNIINVSYTGITSPDTNLQQMLNNLLILPRPPVFIANKATGATDFRYWLDLNRNGVFDPSGTFAEVDTNGNSVVNTYVGDPEFIGVLNHPDQRHSPSNFFVARYAFIALPIGNSLDINYIHNQGKLLSGNPIPKGSPWGPGIWDAESFLRNQGVGSWELNLAGFLYELNKTYYDATGAAYNYNTNSGNFPSGGRAFEDATAILQYRYAEDRNLLRSFKNLYGSSLTAVPSFTSDYIDGYAHGPLMTGIYYNVNSDPDATLTGLPWAGDYSTNQFYTTQDLFTKVPYFQGNLANAATSFSNFLYSAGRAPIITPTNSIINSLNHYTFYRMLSQMSFGSQPAEYPYQNPSVPALAGNANYMSAYSNVARMHLNYKNVNGTSATTFSNWTDIEFFTSAADRMLRAYFPAAIGTNNGGLVYLSVTNIPIYPTNYYTPAVHRILQLAANMYDASTNKMGAAPDDLDYPSVFQPYFVRTGAKQSSVYIAGYSSILKTNSVVFSPPLDLRRPLDLVNLPVNKTNFVNIYGIPYVIGAKPGFPSFNKFSSTPMVQVFRKMQVVHPVPLTAASGPGWFTNVQYTIGVSNLLAFECWYPSTNAHYPRGVMILASDDYSMSLTNDAGAPAQSVSSFVGVFTNVAPLTWPGSTNMVQGSTANILKVSFTDPLITNVVVCNDSVLLLNPSQLLNSNQVSSSNPFQTTPPYFQPKFGLNITNRVRLMMIDSSGRIIDYVQLGGLGQMPGPDTHNDIMNDLTNLDGSVAARFRFWSPDKMTNGVPLGFFNQVTTGQGGNGPAGSIPNNIWKGILLNNASPSLNQIQAGMTQFNNFFGLTSSTSMAQNPVAAYRHYSTVNTWSVNDPFVRFTLPDLTDLTQTVKPTDFVSGSPVTNTFRTVSSLRYQPWGVPNSNPNLKNVYTNVYPFAMPYKDPLVGYADAWQFTSNKFPNVGWLGRVHRGTPWQTVYLKSAPVANSDWQYWTGNFLTNYSGVDASFTQPGNDWLLMDLFTSAPNENASKGQLSINQSGTAAWAAVLDGVIALNNTATNLVPWKIDPANTFTNNGNPTNTVEFLVSSINQTRAAAPSNTFNSMGQICSVPQLTINSPFIDTNGPFLSDAVVERIPQQIMSLLRVGTPRYVIFAYGQSLKPADRSIVTSGPFFGMCTNYQITGEVATRTVVRFDNFPIPGHPNTPRAVVESFNVLPPE